MNSFPLIEDGWICIDTPEIWASVDQLINEAEDGVMKDLQWSNRTFVDADSNMVYDGNPKLWILFQLQSQPVNSIEFLFMDVAEVYLDEKAELSVNVSFLRGQTLMTLSASEDNDSTMRGPRIIANQLYYRLPETELIGDKSFSNFN